MAFCDALLDYYMPNQAQRDRAYRELLRRQYMGGGNVRLPARVPAADGDADGAEEVGGGGDRNDGAEEMGDVHDSERDADDDVGG